jgi:transposase
MLAITTVGLDIAKSVFQVHGVDARGSVVVRRQLKRRYVLAFFKKLPPCLVGIEACASSHHWSRELQALGHTVRLIPPAYVKPYVKRQKNDAADAEAICEAVQRPSMRFVPTKTIEQQSCLMLHRTRHLFIRQQTAIINTIRAHLAEFGVVAPVGRNGVEDLLYAVADQRDERIPEVARGCLEALGALLGKLKAQILEFDRQINGIARTRRAAGSMNFPVSALHSQPRWLRVLPIQKRSDRAATSRPGSAWSPSRTRAGVERSSAASPSKETAICAACSQRARWRSSAMPRSTAPSIARGLLGCSSAAQRKSPRSRSPTRSRAWPGR